MKRKLKLFLIFILVVVAMIMISFIKSDKVEATTAHSADEAIAYVKSNIGTKFGDGNCVHLVSAYYTYLGQPSPSYNYTYELAYRQDYQPTGWQTIANAQPQKGDILIYGPTSSNPYGHVAIYESDYATYHQNYHNNLDPVELVTYYFKNAASNYWGVVRPDFIDNRDRENPVISEAFIDMSSITSSGFKINVKATDNDKIDRIRVAVWTELEGSNVQSDLIWIDCSYNQTTGYNVANVRKSDFNNKTCMYRIHVYAFDSSGNQACKVLTDIPMGSTVVNLGNSFKARIVLSSNNNYAIGAGGSSLRSRLQLQNKSNNNTQLWEFKRNSNGSYHIKNVGTGLYMDIDGASKDEQAQALLYSSNDTKAQQFYIMSYNGHYRLVSGCSPDWKTIAIPGGDIHHGANLVQNSAVNMNNKAQTFSIEKEKDYTLGDVNNDGFIDVSDAIKVLQHSSGKIKLTDTEKLAANVADQTQDVIDVSDAIKILQFSSGKINKFE